MVLVEDRNIEYGINASRSECFCKKKTSTGAIIHNKFAAVQLSVDAWLFLIEMGDKNSFDFCEMKYNFKQAGQSQIYFAEQ